MTTDKNQKKPIVPITVTKVIALLSSFLLFAACSTTPSRTLTQEQLIGLTDKINLVSANGFICEKEGASDRESLVEWSCSRLSSNEPQGTDCDKKLLKKFTATATGPFITRLTQVIEGVIVNYDPLSGCLSFIDSKMKKSWVFDINGKVSDFKNGELKDKCPIQSPNIKRHPMGFIMMSDTEI